MRIRITVSLLMVTILAIAGCERQSSTSEAAGPAAKTAKSTAAEPAAKPAAVKEAGQSGASNVATFRTAEKAPADFDAWSFMWMGPERGSGAKLEYVVLKPDGDEYFRLDVTQAPAGQPLRSDFAPGSSGGDPAVFYGAEIVFQIRASEGKLRFQNPKEFGFEFFKKQADGKIDWAAPFARVKAVVSEK